LKTASTLVFGFSLQQNGYDECSKTNPLRCELGDQSGKHELFSVGSGPRFYTDVNLDIVDQFAGIYYLAHSNTQVS